MITVSTFGYPRHQVDTPTKYTLVHNAQEGYDIAYIQDGAIIDYMNGSLVVPETAKVVLRVCEEKTTFYQPGVHKAIHDNPDKHYDMLLTWEVDLLSKKNAVFCPVTDSSQWTGLTAEAFKVYEKSKLVSAISSNKAFLPGHVTRLGFINAVKHRLDMYGRGFNDIPTKMEGLRDYMFSVTIENCTPTNAFSEKIQDCFLVGTIPIYYGPPNIGDFYDANGILTFTTQEELDHILDNLTPEMYYSRMVSVLSNYVKAFQYPTTNDSMYDLYFKQLI